MSRWHLELFQLWEDPDFSFFEVQIISYVDWLLGHTCSALSIESVFHWMNQGPWTIQLMEDFHLQTEGRNDKGGISQSVVWVCPLQKSCAGNGCHCRNSGEWVLVRISHRWTVDEGLGEHLSVYSARSTPILWPRTLDYKGLESISLFPTMWGLGKVHTNTLTLDSSHLHIVRDSVLIL